MSCKIGDKFIIEINGIIGKHPSLGQKVYSVKTFGNGCILEGELDYLEKYKENPFTQEDCDRARQEGYEGGLKVAWEAARKITVPILTGGFSGEELIDIFNPATVDEIFAKNTASEAIAKIKAYEEQKKAEEKENHLCNSCKYLYPECTTLPIDIDFGKYTDSIIKCNRYEKKKTGNQSTIEVGDEVKSIICGNIFVVTEIGYEEHLYGISFDGKIYFGVNKESWVKTGRHFDIRKILEAMREE